MAEDFRGRALCLVATWFVCSVITELADAIAITELRAPLTLALWKFAVSVPCGAIAIHVSGQGLPAGFLSAANFRRVLPLAALIAMAKLFTYISYEHVPLATAQVAKAASPVAAVLMTRFVLGERFGLQSYLALIPIVLGVCLGVGVGVHLDINAAGVGAALLSCVFQSAQAIYSKSLLAEGSVGLRAYPPLALNLLTAAGCVGLFLPVWLSVQAGVLPATLDGGRQIIAIAGQARRTTSSPLAFALGVGALTQYLQSAAAYCFLDLVSPATSVVVGTARKPFIVVVSVVAFATPLSILNTLGILLCFAGVFWYTWSRHVADRRRDKAAERLRKQLMLHSPVEASLNGSGGGGGGGGVGSGSGSGGSSSPGSSLSAQYGAWLVQQPLLVKAITSGVLYGAGDFIAQTAVALRTEAVASRPFEGNRCLRAIVFASVFLAPLTHAHDPLLEGLVVVRWRLRRAHAAWAKLVLAQFVLWSYFSAAYYHVVLGALQGLPPLECMHALASSFWPTVWAQASAADCD